MFWKIGEMKAMYDKYKKLQDALKKLVIRASAGDYTYMADWVEKTGSVVVEITGEMKLNSVEIKDESIMTPSRKSELEGYLHTAFEKAQTKAQEVSMTKTKEILGFDPQDLMWGLAGGAMPKIPGLT
jgi:DNA-binding protein YbaB